MRDMKVWTRRGRGTVARGRGSIAIVAFALWATACAPGGDSAEVSGGNAPSPGNGEEVVIGVLAPVTGFMSTHGTAIRDGAQLAADELNDGGGIGGRPVRLAIADGASDPATNTERARQLIGRDGAHFLVGTGSSAETLAVADVATENEIPFIYSLDGEIKTCAPGNADEVNPYVFASGPSPEMLLGSFLPEIMEQYGDRIYFVGSDYVFPRSLNAVATGIVEDQGGTVVEDNYIPTDTTDYSPEIRSVLNADADVLFLTLPGNDGITFVRQARQFGVFDEMEVTGSATFDTENYTGFGEEAAGVVVVNRYSEFLENPENQRFVEAFREEYPGHEGPIGPTAAAGAYGSVMALAAAVEEAGSTDADEVIEALEGLRLELPQGTIEIDPQNHMFNQPLYQMVIRDGNYHVEKELGMTEHPGFEGCSVS